MTPPNGDRRHLLALGLGAALAATAQPSRAAAPFPALERPAAAVRAPQRSVLLSVAQAAGRIVAVGERGIVVLSDDLGVRWRQAASVPTSVTLTAVRFAGDRQGWAVGHGGVILHTADGGEHWQRQADGRSLAAAALQAAATEGTPAQQQAARQLLDDGPDKPLLDLCLLDDKRGFVVGAANLCFETADGGRTWASAVQRIDNPKALHLYAMRAHGGALYVAGEQGLLLRSRDGGRTFVRLGSPYAGSWFTLAVTRPGTIIAAGLRGNVFTSADDGASWAPVAGAPAASIVAAAAAGNGTLVLATQAGQVLTRPAAGGPLRLLDGPPLAPLAGVLPLNDGSLITVGLAGALRVPAGRTGGMVAAATGEAR